jgi:pimeloyl-ACP methyl ester carboxylesterase
VPFLPERVLGTSRTVESLTRSGLPRADAERYVARLADPAAAGPMINWYRAMPWSMRSPSKRSKVPTTYVWGSRDFALGRKAAESTATFVSAPYRFVELKAGHWLPETEPVAVAEHVVSQTGA